jgi:hypothetical protein
MPPGRPKKLDSAKQDQICALITVGCTRLNAARHTGVSCTAIRNLARRDREFADRLRRAEMLREGAALKHIYNAGAKNWRAAAWLLERTMPDDYARKKPKWISYAELDQAVHEMIESYAEHMPDPETRNNMYVKLGAICNRFAAEKCAMEDPYPRRRHRCKKITDDDDPVQAPDRSESDACPTVLALSDHACDDNSQPNWYI